MSPEPRATEPPSPREQASTRDKELSRGEQLCQLLMNEEITRSINSAYLDNIVFRIIRAFCNLFLDECLWVVEIIDEDYISVVFGYN